jgi:hypothetical protein
LRRRLGEARRVRAFASATSAARAADAAENRGGNISAK